MLHIVLKSFGKPKASALADRQIYCLSEYEPIYIPPEM